MSTSTSTSLSIYALPSAFISALHIRVLILVPYMLMLSLGNRMLLLCLVPMIFLDNVWILVLVLALVLLIVRKIWAWFMFIFGWIGSYYRGSCHIHGKRRGQWHRNRRGEEGPSDWRNVFYFAIPVRTISIGIVIIIIMIVIGTDIAKIFMMSANAILAIVTIVSVVLVVEFVEFVEFVKEVEVVIVALV